MKAEEFNRYILDRMHRDTGTPVYTIHAEVEGIAYQHDFDALLTPPLRRALNSAR